LGFARRVYPAGLAAAGLSCRLLHGDGPDGSLFERSYALGPTLTAANYDVAPDGRFLMVKRETGSGRLNVVVNWIEALKS
jgi:hypothetical protein